MITIDRSAPVMVTGATGYVAGLLVKKLLENSRWNGAGMWFRKFAGTTIAILGGCFIITPFLN